MLKLGQQRCWQLVDVGMAVVEVKGLSVERQGQQRR
jgi:hypothetical protein